MIFTEAETAYCWQFIVIAVAIVENVDSPAGYYFHKCKHFLI